MSDYEIAIVIFVAISSSVSYFLGHKKGITNTVEYLEEQGLLEFEE
jgi:hypothetical protein